MSSDFGRRSIGDGLSPVQFVGNGAPLSWHEGTESKRQAGAPKVSEKRAVACSWVPSAINYARGCTVLLGYAAAFSCIYLLAYIIRFDGAIPPHFWSLAVATLPVVILIKSAVFYLSGNCRASWRHVTLTDLTRLSETATLAAVLSLLAISFCWTAIPIPRSVFFLDWVGTILIFGGLRVARRAYRERYRPLWGGECQKRALIVGANNAGVAILRNIQAQPQLGIQVVGFLDAHYRRGHRIGCVEVLGLPEDVERVAADRRIDTILIPTPATPARLIRTLVEAGQRMNVAIQVVPGFDAILDGTLTVQPRDVAIEDLLCRQPIKIEDPEIHRLLEGRTVLVTGAAGSIGSELCRQILRYRPEKIVLLDHSENGLFFLDQELQARAHGVRLVCSVTSVTDAAGIRLVFAEHKPSVVFHAAAHKHVPLMEANPAEAAKNNVGGTQIVADESARHGVEAYVMISSDKAVNPSSVMGACKRLGEMYVQALAGSTSGRFITVRFGNVLGSSGSVVPIFKEQICKGGPITVTHPDMTRYFMTIPEAARLVLQAGALGKGNEIFVLDMGVPIRVVDLAKDMIRLSGLVEGKDIEIHFTGIRPGEKLNEEVHTSLETCMPTAHPKIFLLEHPNWCLEEVRKGIAKLLAAARTGSRNVRRMLHELVPEFENQQGIR